MTIEQLMLEELAWANRRERIWDGAWDALNRRDYETFDRLITEFRGGGQSCSAGEPEAANNRPGRYK